MKLSIGCIAILIFFSACEKDNNTNNDKMNPGGDGKLSIIVKNMVGLENLIMSDLRYTNNAGNMYSVSMLKYYISNVTLHKKNGGNTSFQVYELIDAAIPASCIFDVGTLTEGAYDSLTFYIGVDQTRNHTGAQDGDLDVSKGMFWTWNTGYIFFKHEGQYKNSLDQTKSLIFHLGSDNGYSKVQLPIDLNISGNKVMTVKLDLNSVYTSPTNIDFNVDNNRQSTSAGDATWISQIKTNFSDAFSFIKVE